jgi:D-glycero-beta-D-manno-heptose 1-phosphate adenylyltransferase
VNKLEFIQSKIHIAKEGLFSAIQLWNFRNQKIVFTNGCFDIIHKGHIEYLHKAADLGDILIVGLNTDESVKKLKGPTRPYFDQYTRALILASLHYVSQVVMFDEQTPYELIKYIRPDILVKGSDYKPEEIVGYDIVTAKGGQVVTIDLTPGFSSTAMIDKINVGNGKS